MSAYEPYSVGPGGSTPYVPYTPKPKPARRSYTVGESVFAWLCMGLGFFFWRGAMFTGALGGTIFLWMAFAGTAIFLKCRGAVFRTLPVVAMGSALVLSLAMFLSSNGLLQLGALVYGAAAWCYFVSHTAGASAQISSARWGADLCRAMMLPFVSMEDGQLFRGMVSHINRKRSGTLLKMLGGIGIAIIPTAIVVALLSYDSAFTELLQKILRVDWEEIFVNLLMFALGIPVGMYLFGLYLSAADRRMPDLLGEEACGKLSARAKIVPMLTTVTAVVPLLAVYVLFFVSQWKYYISGFTGVLPEGFSYAQYAREGFFQLCMVSVINLSTILLVLLLMKRNKGAGILLKVLTTVFAVFTLVLIATAMAKLVMYINCYGLTPRRVYAAWLMVVLGLVFVVLAVSRFVRKISASAWSLAVVLVCFSGLALCNADHWIAKYNVDRYLNGTLKSVDVASMCDQLGDAAVPELVRLAEALDVQNKTDITKVTYKVAIQRTDLYHCLAVELMYVQENMMREKENGESPVFAFTLNKAMADRAMKRLGTMQKVTNDWDYGYDDYT